MNTIAIIKENPDTVCNPVNISYRYQDNYFSRESADPCVIRYKDDYYLFASHGSGYWWSSDMAEWNFVYIDKDDPDMLPEIRLFAPGACVVDDLLYITHSEGGGIYKTTDPKSGRWEYVGKPVSWGDPALFTDDDGSVFCYYGLSDREPLYAVQLDPDNDMALIDGPVVIADTDMPMRGWERSGDYNENPDRRPYLEGAWMTKHDGKYYLQYATPGTQYSTYANGCYVGDGPMGPFEYCDYSPVSFKSTGFARGAGHGSTIEDKHGNWWKFDTIAISVNHDFERRLIMLPAAFTDGMFVTNAVFADYPIYKPDLFKDINTPGPDWNLVSYKANAASIKASSVLEARDGRTFEPENAFDENIKTWWSAKTGNSGEWLEIDLGGIKSVNAVQINFADCDAQNTTDRNNNYCHRYTLEFSADGESMSMLADKKNAVSEPFTAQDTTHDYFELENPINVRFVRITNHGSIPAGGRFAVSGIRLFGSGQGEKPAAVSGVTVTRHKDDERCATISWNAVPNAEGYIVRYGCNKNFLNIHHQVIGQNTVTVRNLTAGVEYHFAVDAYNENGKTPAAAAATPTERAFRGRPPRQTLSQLCCE
ncbi:MAG: family 43 glycosylhydrolase, partial [Oscillospiraceae bacterium]|nr:family 43 glycosylhydrolase [Oscillospiraceae bacterium]